MLIRRMQVRNFFRSLFFLLGYLAADAGLYAQAAASDLATAALYIQKAEDFELTGAGKESEWMKTDWVKLNPGKDTGPQWNTQIKILYSEKGIYALFVCEDSKITAKMKKDFDNLFLEDVVEMFLWPDENIPIYLEYELSPLNKELFILVPNLDHRFYGWRPWHFEQGRATRHAVNIVKKNSRVVAWTAEVFIPWSVMEPLLKSQPKKGDRWRINLYRIDYDSGFTTWTWRKIEKNFHDYEKYGTAIFN